MFPLIAIAAFFILAIAFFVFGKDDFGITRVKEVSDETNLKVKEVENLKSAQKNNSIKNKEQLVSAEIPSEIDSSINPSD